MRTVVSLIEELKKYPPEALVWAYEGEVTGLGVRWPGPVDMRREGFIFCTDDRREEPPSYPLPPREE